MAYSWTLEELLKSAYKADKVDPNLRFKNQPSLGGCTGFLIAPNIMVTAGHCISGDQHEIRDGKVVFHKSYNDKPENMKFGEKYWVVDYTNDIRMTRKTQEGKGYYVATIPTSKQYGVKKVLIGILDRARGLDYAVILLDRETDRAPFRFRTGAKIAKGDNLAMIGAPAGLPLKLADGAKVTMNSAGTWFGTNIDAFGGNSGGPVYNTAGLNMIEGILVRGRVDKGAKGYYVDSTCSCVKEVRYDNVDAESIYDDLGYAPSTMSTEVQRITSMPLSIKALAVYNNLEYAIRKNNAKRYNAW
ncbi:MAG: V8-like Glu-specific endopeptidase [Bacteroidia bacterium]|jgi:V8-like Glu-specific endopeptidase